MSARKKETRSSRKPRVGFVVALVIVACATVVVFTTGRTSSIEVPQITAPKLTAAQKATVEQARHKVLATDGSADAWGRYGMVLRAFDFDREALRCFRAAASLDPKNPRWPYFISRILRAEKPSESLDFLKRVVDMAGSTPEAPQYYLAKALAEEGRVNEAEDQANALLKAHPDFVPVRLLLAQAAFSRGDTNAAAANVKMCLEDPRTSRSALALLATLQQRQNDIAGAQESARKSAAASADLPIADSFESEISALRGNPSDITDRVHRLLAARNIPEAAPLINQLIRDRPDFAEGWLLQGRLLLIQKQFPAAEEALLKHLQLDPQSTQGHFQLGSVYLSWGKFPGAEQAFRKAIELKQDFGPAWFNLAYAQGRQGKWVEAAPNFQQAIRYNPEHIESYLLLADVRLQLGDATEAEKLLESAVRINPIDPRIAPIRQKLSRAK